MQVLEASNFAENLRSQITEYGAVSELAKHVGISRVQMSRYVNGKAVPDLKEAESIANYLGFQLAQMLMPPEKFSKLAKISLAERI